MKNFLNFKKLKKEEKSPRVIIKRKIWMESCFEHVNSRLIVKRVWG